MGKRVLISAYIVKVTYSRQHYLGDKIVSL